MASARRFTQITTIATEEGVVLYALDGVGRVWKHVDGQDCWVGLPGRRHDEAAPRPRWTSTARRPIDSLAEPPMEWLGR